MNCKDVREFLDGHRLTVLSAAERLKLDAHMTECAACCNEVAASQLLSNEVIDPPRVGSMIAGFEVPHVHVHVLPISDLGDLSFANAAQDPDDAEMDQAAEAIGRALRDLGHGEHVPD